MVNIYASLLAAPLLKLESVVKELEAAPLKGLHIDVMDGHFVPNLTFGPDFVKALKKLTKLELDVHLMVQDPAVWIQAFAAAGADAITFHVEATVHSHRLCQMIRALSQKMKVGIALNPGTSWQAAEPVLHMVDRVLVMSVNPGFSHQEHLHCVHNKIEALHAFKQHSLTYSIQVDGGVNTQLVPILAAKGVTECVVGGALFDGKPLAENITSLST